VRLGRSNVTLGALLVLLGTVGALSLRAAAAPAVQALSREVTRADFDRLMQELSNWGRGARTIKWVP
jgi:hypothetical protein